ncbi:MAG: hypothetical protein EOO73_30750 [Myxococcales bacterium]|nr:MAG: hypothetical protein EOO73_30750 [Myxococcales bacterium]
MAEIIPLESKRHDPHGSVTLAPPAPPPSLEPDRDGQFRPALDAGARASTRLGELSRMVAELSGGLSGARRVSDDLLRELETLRAFLGSASELRLALEQRVGQLEAALSESEELRRRERLFLTEQHDAFLLAVLEEHEQALGERDVETAGDAEAADLAQQLAHAEGARLQAEAAREQAEVARFAVESELARAHEALSQAHAARDDARALAERRERERDELRAEASRLRARLGTSGSSTAPPPPHQHHDRAPSFHLPAALTLDEGELDSNLHLRAITPRLPSVAPRFGVPRASEPSRPPSSAPDATVTPFPRETTRPGVGGPKLTERPLPPSFGPPPSGWTPPPPQAEEPSILLPRLQSAANLPQGLPSLSPLLKQKPDPTTRPLIDYSLGEGGVQSELLEGARLSSTPPRK